MIVVPSSRGPTLLALDTATRQASVAVCRGDLLLAEAEREVTTHSEGLLPLIQETLSRAGLAIADVDAVVCGRGPGSFTGLRIGMATAKGLCLAARRPLICISSLLALARAADEAIERAGGPAAAGLLVAAVLDARRQEVFLGLYRDGELLEPEAALPPAELSVLLAARDEAVVLVGDGALAYQGVLLAGLAGRGSLAPPECHLLRARHLLAAARARLAAGDVDDLETAVPLYVRPPDARLPTKPFAGLGGGGAARPDPGAEERRLLEQLWETGLRLDREGRWWHEGQQVEHPRLVAALHRWLDRLEDGRYVLRLDAQRVAAVEVEDAPFIVRTIELDGQGAAVRVHLRLSDGSEEELDYASVRGGPDNALYATVKQRFTARFSRQAYYLLCELIEEHEGAFALRSAGRIWPIDVPDPG